MSPIDLRNYTEISTEHVFVHTVDREPEPMNRGVFIENLDAD